MIEFPCPSCGKILKVSDKAAGRSGQCKHCGNTIVAPAATPRPQEPSAPPADAPPETPNKAVIILQRGLSATGSAIFYTGKAVASGLAAMNKPRPVAQQPNDQVSMPQPPALPQVQSTSNDAALRRLEEENRLLRERAALQASMQSAPAAPAAPVIHITNITSSNAEARSTAKATVNQRGGCSSSGCGCLLLLIIVLAFIIIASSAKH